MKFLEFIKDVRASMKAHPMSPNGRRYTYIRNHMYMHSQPKYLYGRIVDKIIRIADKIAYGNL